MFLSKLLEKKKKTTEVIIIKSYSKNSFKICSDLFLDNKESPDVIYVIIVITIIIYISLLKKYTCYLGVDRKPISLKPCR
jgi:hypothetical protein